MAAKAAAAPPDALLSTNEVAAWFDLCTLQVKRMRKNGTGPRFVRMGARSVRYLKSACLEWFAECTQPRLAR